MSSDSLDPHPPVPERPTDVPEPLSLDSTPRLLKMMVLFGILISIIYGVIRISWPSFQEQITGSPRENSSGVANKFATDDSFNNRSVKDDKRPEDAAPSDDSANRKPVQNSHAIKKGSREEINQVNALRDQRTANWSRIVGAYSVVKQTEQDLNALKQASESWTELIAALQTNADGKKIANDQNRLYEYFALLSEEHLSQQQLSTWEEQLAIYFVPLDLAYQTKDRDYIPDQSLLQSLSNLSTQIKTSLRATKRNQRSLNAILKQTQSKKPGEQTLEKALVELQQQIDQKRNQKIAAARQKVEVEYSEQLAKLAADKARLLEQEKIKKREHENKMLRLAAVEEEAKRKRNEAKTMALHRFQQEYPKVKSLLVAFTTKDYTQVGVKQANVYVKTIKKEAASLSAIRGKGAIDDNIKGLQMMYQLGGERNFGALECNRPLGGLPTYSAYDFGKLSSTEIERLKTVQNFLREHGETMVEQGLLVP